MSSEGETAGASSPQISPPTSTTTNTSTARGATERTGRQPQSCTVCRARKVKCDRVQPCRACCVIGQPSKCEFAVSRQGEQYKAISQAEEIRNLRAEVERLKAAINIEDPERAPRERDQPRERNLEQLTEQLSSRLAALDAIIASIRSAPLEEVQTIVLQIRSDRGPEHTATSLSVPPQGYDSNRKRLRRWENQPEYGDSERSDEDAVARFSSRHPRDEWERPEGVTYEPDLGAEPKEERDEDEDADDILCTRCHMTHHPNASCPTSRKRQRSPSPSPSSLTHFYAPASPVQDVFVERFVDAFAPQSHLNCGSSDSIRVAAGIRMFSPLLRQAFQAVSSAFFGQSVADKRIVSIGQKGYLNVLGSLQTALADPETSKSEGLLMTVVLMMAYESVQHTSERALIKHVLGALRLIEFRGPWRHTHGVEHLCFIELRPYWLAAALVARTPTFLAQDEWKTVPWSAGSSIKTVMHHLLDTAVDIPAVLAQFDRFMDNSRTSSTSFTERVYEQEMLWASISDLERRMRRWKKTFADSYPAGQPEEGEMQDDDASSNKNDPFPIFRYRNLATMQVIQPKTLTFPDPLLAQTLCMYYASFLVLSAADSRPKDAIQPYEQYSWACLICRTQEYYIRTVPGNMINRMAFPLSVAYRALPEQGPEREFAREIFRLIERKKMLKSWGHLDTNIK